MGYLGGYQRSVARMFIPQFLAQGFSANRISREFISLGLSYRRTVMLSDIREFNQMKRFEHGLRSLKRTTSPPRNLMTEMEIPYPRRYRVIAEAEVWDSETLQLKTRTVSFYTNTLENDEEWEAQYLSDRVWSEYSPQEEVFSLTSYVVQHQQGWSY